MKKLWILLLVTTILLVGAFISKPHVFYKKSICIQPYGNIKAKHVQEVKDALETFYKYDVTVLDPIELPKSAFTKIRSPRYRADSLIRQLRRIKPKEYGYIIGLTNKDISITKYSDKVRKIIKEPEWKYKDFGIFGLGFRPGSSCVVSTYRLYSGNVNESKMISRLRKIATHELGHNLGLKHCSDVTCLMTSANERMSTIDNVEGHLCGKCFQKIN